MDCHKAFFAIQCIWIILFLGGNAMHIIRQEQNGVPFYACTGFDGVAHGFSTRIGGVSPAPWDSLNLGANRGDAPDHVTENFRRFCGAVGTDFHTIIKNHQVHSDRIRAVTHDDVLPSAHLSGNFDGDGLITDIPGLCLTIFSADCIPVLLYDPVKRVIAATHAGWRGTALGIAAKAVQRMQSDYACRPQDILAAIGPGISPCCFETHADVPDGLLNGMGEDAAPFIRPLSREGKFSVDLKGANGRWLERVGLLPQHIAISDACTACDRESFWSHRILGQQRGSMAAMIQLL